MGRGWGADVETLHEEISNFLPKGMASDKANVEKEMNLCSIQLPISARTERLGMILRRVILSVLFF